MRKEEALIHVWWILGPDGRTPPTKDKRVREALNLAIDRNEIAQSISAAMRSRRRSRWGSRGHSRTSASR